MKKLLAVATLGVVAVAAVGLAVARMVHEAANTQPSSAAQPSTPAQPTPKPADRWQVEATADIAGSKHITLESHDVVVRCVPKLEMYVIPYASNIIDYNDVHEQSVRYKLGDEKGVHASSWAVSDDATALFLPMEVALSAIKADKLTLEYREYERTASTETFDLTGLNEAFHNAGCPTTLPASRTSHAVRPSPSSSYTLPDGRKVEPGLLNQ